MEETGIFDQINLAAQELARCLCPKIVRSLFSKPTYQAHKPKLCSTDFEHQSVRFDKGISAEMDLIERMQSEFETRVQTLNWVEEADHAESLQKPRRTNSYVSYQTWTAVSLVSPRTQLNIPAGSISLLLSAFTSVATEFLVHPLPLHPFINDPLRFCFLELPLLV